MPSRRPHPEPDPFLQNLIRSAAWTVLVRAGFQPQEHPDLVQELYAQVVRGWPNYRRRRGHRYTFWVTVVQRRATNLLRDYRARQRRTPRTVSLHTPIPADGAEPVELAAVVGQHDGDARCGRHRRTDRERAELAADVDLVLARLPAKYRLVARRLMEGQSKAAIARELHMPRTTLQGWVKRIAWHLEKAGLDDYLGG